MVALPFLGVWDVGLRVVHPEAFLSPQSDTPLAARQSAARGSSSDRPTAIPSALPSWVFIATSLILTDRSGIR